MAFTDNSDLFGALDEAGINLVAKHLRRQRPSLFNYGTEFFLKNPKLLCHEIDVDPLVHIRNNPLITVESPLPVLGTGGLINLNYAIQLTDAKIDFHKNNVINLPPEIADIPEQHFAITAKVCAGLGCPDEKLSDLLEDAVENLYDIIDLNDVVPGTTNLTHAIDQPKTTRPNPITIPVRRLECFCLEVHALCHIETRKVGNQTIFSPKLDKFEIVDIEPKGLEQSLECYASQVLRLGLLPRIRVGVEKMVFDQLKLVSIALKPTEGLANNPSIEDDQLKIFIDMEVA